MGPKFTTQFSARLVFRRNGYEFTLVPTPDNRLIFANETAVFYGHYRSRQLLGSGHAESLLRERAQSAAVPQYVFESLSSWIVYHFHDTSLAAAVRRPRAINDNLDS
jgi:predicted ATPase